MSKPMEIYVDADACPVKNEIYRVAERHGITVHVVSNSPIAVPREPWISRVVVGAAMDAADDWIAERAGPNDIVITADVPLASRSFKAGATVIAPNGKPFDDASIGMTSSAAQAPSPAGRSRSTRATARGFCRRSISPSCG
jgi:uncharacterized protein YaiI (UPF0178 family)